MSIVLEHLTKCYEGHPVVNNVDLNVANGEFFVLLGPSGSGKSTVLRMIAGLTNIDQGRVLLQGQDVTQHLPQQRGVGFVFQHYALFRHMTVGDNVEFALRIRRVSRHERRRRRDELLELVGLAGLGQRMPHQLSGGQQQRVALARALAHQPAVLLLDEPFGALDAKIRVELRRTLKDVQRELQMTTIFVTHDQEEAFELADRLGVMNAGRLLEVGTPEELYQRPQTEFVATFLGTANLLIGECTAHCVRLGPLQLALHTEPAASAAQRVQVLFRPEDVVLAPSVDSLSDPPLGQAEVEHTTFVGAFERLRLRLPALPGVQPIAPPVPFGNQSVLVEATRSPDQARQFPLRVGDSAWIGVHRVHALTHPGLRLLILTDAASSTQPALGLGGQLARLAHARTTILGYGQPQTVLEQHVQTAKEQLSSGLPALEAVTTSDPPVLGVAQQAERQPYDLVILGVQPQGGLEVAEQQLQRGRHHLLLVPEQWSMPSRMLICVASGEPGKEDVLFAGRLARHLGASATLLSVVAPHSERENVALTERFLAAGARSLATLGIPAQTKVRTGNVRHEIMAEMSAGGHDMLVLGAPLGSSDGRTGLTVVFSQIVGSATNYPVLIVRSRYAAQPSWITVNGRVSVTGEVLR